MDGQVQDQTQAEPNWTESKTDWPVEQRQHFAKYKDEGEAFKGSYETAKKLGSAIWLPSEKDKPEEKAAKMKDIALKLGAAEKAEDYMSLIKLPEGMQLSEKRAKKYAEMAVEAGIPKSVFEKLVKADIADQIEAIEDFQKSQVSTKADADAKVKAEEQTNAMESVKRIQDVLHISKTEYDDAIELQQRFVNSYSKDDGGKLFENVKKSIFGKDANPMFFQMFTDFSRFYLAEDRPTALGGTFRQATGKTDPEKDAFTLRRDR